MIFYGKVYYCYIRKLQLNLIFQSNFSAYFGKASRVTVWVVLNSTVVTVEPVNQACSYSSTEIVNFWYPFISFYFLFVTFWLPHSYPLYPLLPFFKPSIYPLVTLYYSFVSALLPFCFFFYPFVDFYSLHYVVNYLWTVFSGCKTPSDKRFFKMYRGYHCDKC